MGIYPDLQAIHYEVIARAGVRAIYHECAGEGEIALAGQLIVTFSPFRERTLTPSFLGARTSRYTPPCSTIVPPGL